MRARVELFTSQWVWVRAVRSSAGGVYRMNGLPPGSYHVQASDRRKPWDISRLARADASFTVAARQHVERNLVLRRGAYLTGSVSVGKPGKPGRRAIVRAVSEYGASFETTADTHGRFALGGLPGGQKYSVFTWDRAKKWAAKSVYAGKLKPGQGRNLSLRLRTRTGGFAGVVRVNGVPLTGRFTATIVSSKTGQWWTARIVNGDLSRFRGLYPGAYVLHLPQTREIAAQSVKVGTVRSGRTRLVRVAARPLW